MLSSQYWSEHGLGHNNISSDDSSYIMDHHQPHVLSLPSLYEEKDRISDQTPQHPLQSPSDNLSDGQSGQHSLYLHISRRTNIYRNFREI